MDSNKPKKVKFKIAKQNEYFILYYKVDNLFSFFNKYRLYEKLEESLSDEKTITTVKYNTYEDALKDAMYMKKYPGFLWDCVGRVLDCELPNL